jgi:hypothetical protein
LRFFFELLFEFKEKGRSQVIRTSFFVTYVLIEAAKLTSKVTIRIAKRKAIRDQEFPLAWSIIENKVFRDLIFVNFYHK